MSGIKILKNKIYGVRNTRKITNAMEMISASKMRKAQIHIHSILPYSNKVRDIASDIFRCDSEYQHPYLKYKKKVKSVGIIVITTNKGLCGGLNSNIFRIILSKLKFFEKKNISFQITVLGKKGIEFFKQIGVYITSESVKIYSKTKIEYLLNIVENQINNFLNDIVQEVYLAYTKFLSIINNCPTFVRILPISKIEKYEVCKSDYSKKSILNKNYKYKYIYEPSEKSIIDYLFKKYIENFLFQSLLENIASEHSSRMISMKSASENANKIIDNLELMYNKKRQNIITQELSEIVY